MAEKACGSKEKERRHPSLLPTQPAQKQRRLTRDTVNLQKGEKWYVMSVHIGFNCNITEGKGTAEEQAGGEKLKKGK